MIRIGASTANLYPLETERRLTACWNSVSVSLRCF